MRDLLVTAYSQFSHKGILNKLINMGYTNIRLKKEAKIDCQIEKILLPKQ